jgi:hypothetical protein
MSWLNRVRVHSDSRFLAILAISSVLFFLVYASFYWGNNGRYPSPDEQANAVFAQTFAREGTLTISRTVLEDIVRPRSVNVVGSNFVPGFFLGLVLVAGWVGKWLGLWAIPLVPIVLAAVAPFGYYLVTRRVFDTTTARVSTLLMFFLPAWAYYASRGFLPNVSMISAYLIGLGLLLSAHTQHTLRRSWLALALAAVAGFSFGFSFAVRPVEWFWGVGVLFALALVYRKQLRVRLLACLVAGFALPLSAMAYWQQKTYGSWYATGYDQFGGAAEGSGVEAGFSLASFAMSVGRALFPFGFDPLLALSQFWNQVFGGYWWLLPLVVLGCFIYWKSPTKIYEQKVYSVVFLAISVYLISYYGSWIIADHPDPNWVSIGTAYHRYWLPIFVLSLPYLVLGLRFFSTKLREIWVPAQWLPWAAMIAMCVAVTFGLGDDSLGRLAANGVKYEGLRERVLASTPVESVIASERNDKVFWPDRQVIHFADNDYPALAKSVRNIQAPLYVLSRLPASHAEVVEQRDFAIYGLRFETVFTQEEFTLYRIVRLQP